ncbi:HK97 family phage prohead protease [Paenibacillus alba]|uniref:HK97 family phage prohead protease n=1 Tax=Paenibacillus alba TaxID=1197127 RepID=UPI001564F61E|nr:HK97 family phage prohead protease [Paenibacillus alba]NQX67974.1 HK97 family phage prohead protease [Paenibacillus alba]
MVGSKKEVRYLQASEFQIRAASEGDNTMGISGYVVKFNQRSQLIYGEFYERVAQGAFLKSLQENKIIALWNHRTDFVLGSSKNKTLRLQEDDVGLHFEIDLPNSTWGKDAFESIQRGDVDGVSFGFNVRGDSWSYLQEEDVYERTLLDIDLREISPTPFPAYLDSEVSKRSVEQLGITTKEHRRLEKEKLLIEIDLLGIL